MSIEPWIVPNMYAPEEVAEAAKKALPGADVEVLPLNGKPIIWIELCDTPSLALHIQASSEQSADRVPPIRSFDIYKNESGNPSITCTFDELAKALRLVTDNMLYSYQRLISACHKALGDRP